MSFGTIKLRLSGKYWRSSAEVLFSSKPTGGGSTPSLGLRGELLSYDSLLQWEVISFLQGKELCNQNPPSQAGKFSSGCTALSPKVAAPMGHPSLAGDKAAPGLRARSGACGFLVGFFKLCTIFRRRWTVLARGQRQPSPCQEARCMVTLPGSPWQGWESFSRCDQTACGSRRSRAACLRGSTALCHRAWPNPPPNTAPQRWVLLLPGASSPYGWLWSKEQDGKALSPGLLPRRSLPPPQQCCGESRASQSADCSDRWQVISPLANLTLEKKIGLGVIQLLGLKARGWRDSTLLWHVLEGCCIPEDCGNKSKVTIKQKSVCRIRQILLKMDNVLRVILSNWISISKMQILLIEFSCRNNLCFGSEATRAPLSFHP